MTVPAHSSTFCNHPPNSDVASRGLGNLFSKSPQVTLAKRKQNPELRGSGGRVPAPFYFFMSPESWEGVTGCDWGKPGPTEGPQFLHLPLGRLAVGPSPCTNSAGDLISLSRVKFSMLQSLIAHSFSKAHSTYLRPPAPP